MTLAHVITRRPHLASHAVATALEYADQVVVGLHGFKMNFSTPSVTVLTGSDYLELTNEVLAKSAEFSDRTLRIDDDDHYPPGHEKLLEEWQSGSTVWGLVTVKACDGRILRHKHPDMCGGVLPTGITLAGDSQGRLGDSLRAQTIPIVRPTGVIKQVCLADQPWIHSQRWQRTINCDHQQKQVAQP